MALINHHIELDDNTYVHGNVLATPDENGNPVEPYYYHDLEKNEEVVCFPSRNLYMVYNSQNLVRIVHTMTCWSDDISEYHVKDGKVVSSRHTSRGQRRSETITYENEEDAPSVQKLTCD